MTSSLLAATDAADQTTGHGPVRELSESFPEHDLLHQIDIRGRCDFATIIAIGEILRASGASLESLAARRYSGGGGLLTCRLRGLADPGVGATVEAIRSLGTVTMVMVSHHLLRSRPGAPDATSQCPAQK
jgi:hypothetical protein